MIFVFRFYVGIEVVAEDVRCSCLAMDDDESVLYMADYSSSFIRRFAYRQNKWNPISNLRSPFQYSRSRDPVFTFCVSNNRVYAAHMGCIAVYNKEGDIEELIQNVCQSLDNIKIIDMDIDDSILISHSSGIGVVTKERTFLPIKIEPNIGVSKKIVNSLLMESGLVLTLSNGELLIYWKSLSTEISGSSNYELDVTPLEQVASNLYSFVL